MPQTTSSSCEELTLPFLYVVCWNFGWFSFFPDSSQTIVPRTFSHPAGALAANAAALPNDIVRANISAVINNVMRFLILSPPLDMGEVAGCATGSARPL